MESIRRFFANFQKNGTISKFTSKKGNFASEENDLTKEKSNLTNKSSIIINSTDSKQKCHTENSKGFSDFQAITTEKHINDRNPNSTSKCLEEFDDILKEINIDVNTESITLDDVNDVLTSKTNDTTLRLETPRFDLQDLVQNCSSNFGCIPIITDLIGATDLYEEIETINLDDSLRDESDEVIANDKAFKEDFIDINTKMSLDVISISSEDSLDIPIIKLKEKDKRELKYERLEGTWNNSDKMDNTQDIEVSQLKSSDVLVPLGFKTEPISNKEETKANTNAITENLGDKLEESTAIENSEVKCKNINKSQSSKANELYIVKKLIEVKSDDITSKVGSDIDNTELNTRDEQNINDKHEETTSECDSDCGYQSSDFEFITEDEAKLDGLIINFKTQATKVILPKQVKTIEISVCSDKFAENDIYGSIVAEDDSNVDSILNNDKNTQINTDVRYVNEQSIVNTNGKNNEKKSSLHYLRSYRRPNRRHLNFVKENNVGFRNDSVKLGKVDAKSNFGPQKYTNTSNIDGNDNFKDTQSDLKIYPSIEHRPNDLKFNYSEPTMGSITSRENCKKLNNDIKRWRIYQQKRKHFILDQSYRDSHLILTDEEYYKLFNPNHMIQQSFRTENKSILSTSSMLIEYDGIGFDMQMVRERESEDEDVKKEAAASAKRILHMYPGENRKRRRRFQ